MIFRLNVSFHFLSQIQYYWFLFNSFRIEGLPLWIAYKFYEVMHLILDQDFPEIWMRRNYQDFQVNFYI